MRICDRRLLFVLDALLWIAEEGASGRPLPQRRLARLQGVPARYLEHDLQRLVRAGILSGNRGPRGGYRLARPAHEIKLAEVIQAISGPLQLAHTAPSDVPSPFLKNAIVPLFAEIEKDLLALLSSRSLADLLAAAAHRREEALARLENVA